MSAQHTVLSLRIRVLRVCALIHVGCSLSSKMFSTRSVTSSCSPCSSESSPVSPWFASALPLTGPTWHCSAQCPRRIPGGFSSSPHWQVLPLRCLLSRYSPGSEAAASTRPRLLSISLTDTFRFAPLSENSCALHLRLAADIPSDPKILHCRSEPVWRPLLAANCNFLAKSFASWLQSAPQLALPPRSTLPSLRCCLSLKKSSVVGAQEFSVLSFSLPFPAW